jgi:hypothetical protein
MEKSNILLGLERREGDGLQGKEKWVPERS